VENIRAISEVVTLPILRPLLGMNKRDIQQLAERIGTYEISIQPFGDCCSLYTPKHPVTKSILSIIHFTEKNWDFQPMLERAITSTKKVTINV
jgi:thiamine biosynthesis protein ThiI